MPACLSVRLRSSTAGGTIKWAEERARLRHKLLTLEKSLEEQETHAAAEETAASMRLETARKDSNRFAREAFRLQNAVDLLRVELAEALLSVTAAGATAGVIAGATAVRATAAPAAAVRYDEEGAVAVSRNENGGQLDGRGETLPLVGSPGGETLSSPERKTPSSEKKLPLVGSCASAVVKVETSSAGDTTGGAQQGEGALHFFGPSAAAAVDGDCSSFVDSTAAVLAVQSDIFSPVGGDKLSTGGVGGGDGAGETLKGRVLEIKSAGVVADDKYEVKVEVQRELRDRGGAAEGTARGEKAGMTVGKGSEKTLEVDGGRLVALTSNAASADDGDDGAGGDGGYDDATATTADNNGDEDDVADSNDNDDGDATDDGGSGSDGNLSAALFVAGDDDKLASASSDPLARKGFRSEAPHGGEVSGGSDIVLWEGRGRWLDGDDAGSIGE